MTLTSLLSCLREDDLEEQMGYKLKIDEHSTCLEYNARHVVKDFNQKKVVDFEEIFSLVVMMPSIGVVPCLVAS